MRKPAGILESAIEKGNSELVPLIIICAVLLIIASQEAEQDAEMIPAPDPKHAPGPQL